MENDGHVHLLRDFGLPTPPASPQRPKHGVRVHGNCTHSYLETPPSTPPLAKGKSGGVQVHGIPYSTDLKSERTHRAALQGSKTRVVSGDSENAPPGIPATCEKTSGLLCQGRVTCSSNCGRSDSLDDISDDVDSGGTLIGTLSRSQSPTDSTGRRKSLTLRSLASLDGESFCQTHEDDIGDADTVSGGAFSPVQLSQNTVPITKPSLIRRLRPSQLPRPKNSVQSGSMKSLDRFIAPRIVQPSYKDRLALTRSVASLTPQEKSTRRRTGLSDPFTPISRIRRPPPQQRQSLTPLPIMQPNRLRAVESEVLALRSDHFSNLVHQASPGAIWNVETSNFASVLNNRNASLQGISSGRGSNVPRYTSRFLEDLAPEADLDIHEKRLALAMDIDLSNRVVPIPSANTTTATSVVSSGVAAWTTGALGRYVWRDNEWIREGLLRRMRLFLSLPMLRY